MSSDDVVGRVDYCEEANCSGHLMYDCVWPDCNLHLVMDLGRVLQFGHKSGGHRHG